MKKRIKINNKYFENIADFKPVNAKESNTILALVDGLEEYTMLRKSHQKNAHIAYLRMNEIQTKLFELKNKKRKKKIHG